MTDNYLSRAFKIPDLRNKIILTLSILALYRFLSHVPVPNVDTEALRAFFDSNQFLGFLNTFTGGGLRNFSIIALGVGPYITASIILQVLTFVVPSLEELSKEGYAGRQKINQYTQALTVPLSLVQAYGVYFIFNTQAQLLPNLDLLELVVVILSMSAGTFLLTWLGERITEYGIGNGISILIFAGILAGLPGGFAGFVSILDTSQIFNALIFIAVSIVVISSVVYVNEAFRKIEIRYSTKVGGRSLSSGSSFIPIKINQAGVIPIIFAVSLVLIPSFLGTYLQRMSDPRLLDLGIWLSSNFTPSSILYSAFYFFLVFGFTYFYTSVTFNPNKISDEIRRGGGFIPGVRPGRSTVQLLKYIINRLTLAGGVFLGLIAVLPSLIQNMTNITTLAIGGTGLLIVVSVVLDTVKQIESQVITREYDNFTR